MAKPIRGREFGMLVNRVLIVGDDEAEHIEVILLVGAERGTVDQAVDHLDRASMLGVITDRSQGKRSDKCEVLRGKSCGLRLDVHRSTLVFGMRLDELPNRSPGDDPVLAPGR